MEALREVRETWRVVRAKSIIKTLWLSATTLIVQLTHLQHWPGLTHSLPLVALAHNHAPFCL